MSANPLKRLAGETAIYGLGTMVPRLLNYLLVPFYTHWIFDQSEYGQITELYAYVALLLVVLTYGLETAFFRYANSASDPKKVFSTATTMLLATTSIFIALLLLFSKETAQLIRYSGHQEFIWLLGLIVGIDAFTALPFAWLRYQKKAKRFSLIRIVSVCITIGFNFILLLIIPSYLGDNYADYFPYNQTSLVGFVLVANLIGSASVLLLLFPELRQFRIGIDMVLVKKLLAYGLPILVIGLAGMINEVSDKILLKYFLPDPDTATAQIGIYGANYKLAVLMMLFIQMFRYAAEPFFFAEAKKKDAKEIYSRVMTWFIVFIWFIFLGVNFYLDLFKYFIGPAFWVGLQIVPIVLAAKMFLGVFYNLSVWYKLTDKTLYGALIAIIGALVTISLNIIFIPKYGYVASAWANFSCYFIMMVISFAWGRHIYKINYELVKILSYSALALLLYILSGQMSFDELWIQLLSNTGLLLVFAVLVFGVERKKLRPATDQRFEGD